MALRAVLVQTGQVLLNVITSKQIYSTATNFDTFIFTETGGTALVEIGGGAARNETATYAVRSAIEAAVLELVHEGIEQEMWDYVPQEVQNESVN